MNPNRDRNAMERQTRPIALLGIVCMLLAFLPGHAGAQRIVDSETTSFFEQSAFSDHDSSQPGRGDLQTLIHGETGTYLLAGCIAVALIGLMAGKITLFVTALIGFTILLFVRHPFAVFPIVLVLIGIQMYRTREKAANYLVQGRRPDASTPEASDDPPHKEEASSVQESSDTPFHADSGLKPGDKFDRPL